MSTIFVDEIPSSAEEVLKIIRNCGVEYVSFSEYDEAECAKVIRLFKNRVDRLVIEVTGWERLYELALADEEFVKLFDALDIKSPWMTCAMYPVVEEPTPVYYSQIDGRVVQIGDKVIRG